jgi:hypothetical protein
MKTIIDAAFHHNTYYIHMKKIQRIVGGDSFKKGWFCEGVIIGQSGGSRFLEKNGTY